MKAEVTNTEEAKVATTETKVVDTESMLYLKNMIATKSATADAEVVEATDKPVAVCVTTKQGDYACEGIRFTAKPFQFYADAVLVETLSKDENLTVEVI